MTRCHFVYLQKNTKRPDNLNWYIDVPLREWESTPNATVNIGVLATRVRLANDETWPLVALDIDVKRCPAYENLAPGAQRWARLKQALHNEPYGLGSLWERFCETWFEASVGGGCHVFFYAKDPTLISRIRAGCELITIGGDVLNAEVYHGDGRQVCCQPSCAFEDGGSVQGITTPHSIGELDGPFVDWLLANKGTTLKHLPPPQKLINASAAQSNNVVEACLQTIATAIAENGLHSVVNYIGAQTGTYANWYALWRNIGFALRDNKGSDANDNLAMWQWFCVNTPWSETGQVAPSEQGVIEAATRFFKRRPSAYTDKQVGIGTLVEYAACLVNKKSREDIKAIYSKLLDSRISASIMAQQTAPAKQPQALAGNDIIDKYYDDYNDYMALYKGARVDLGPTFADLVDDLYMCANIDWLPASIETAHWVATVACPQHYWHNLDTMAWPSALPLASYKLLLGGTGAGKSVNFLEPATTIGTAVAPMVWEARHASAGGFGISDIRYQSFKSFHELVLDVPEGLNYSTIAEHSPFYCIHKHAANVTDEALNNGQSEYFADERSPWVRAMGGMQSKLKSTACLQGSQASRGNSMPGIKDYRLDRFMASSYSPALAMGLDVHQGLTPRTSIVFLPKAPLKKALPTSYPDGVSRRVDAYLKEKYMVQKNRVKHTLYIINTYFLDALTPKEHALGAAKEGGKGIMIPIPIRERLKAVEAQLGYTVPSFTSWVEEEKRKEVKRAKESKDKKVIANYVKAYCSKYGDYTRQATPTRKVILQPKSGTQQDVTSQINAFRQWCSIEAEKFLDGREDYESFVYIANLVYGARHVELIAEMATTISITKAFDEGLRPPVGHFQRDPLAEADWFVVCPKVLAFCIAHRKFIIRKNLTSLLGCIDPIQTYQTRAKKSGEGSAIAKLLTSTTPKRRYNAQHLKDPKFSGRAYRALYDEAAEKQRKALSLTKLPPEICSCVHYQTLYTLFEGQATAPLLFYKAGDVLWGDNANDSFSDIEYFTIG